MVKSTALSATLKTLLQAHTQTKALAKYPSHPTPALTYSCLPCCHICCSPCPALTFWAPFLGASPSLISCLSSLHPLPLGCCSPYPFALLNRPSLSELLLHHASFSIASTQPIHPESLLHCPFFQVTAALTLPACLLHLTTPPACLLHHTTLPACLRHESSLPACLLHHNSLPACLLHHTTCLPACCTTTHCLPVYCTTTHCLPACLSAAPLLTACLSAARQLSACLSAAPHHIACLPAAPHCLPACLSAAPHCLPACLPAAPHCLSVCCTTTHCLPACLRPGPGPRTVCSVGGLQL